MSFLLQPTQMPTGNNELMDLLPSAATQGSRPGRRPRGGRAAAGVAVSTAWMRATISPSWPAIFAARLGVGRIAQQLAGDRGAADPAHDEGLAQPVARRRARTAPRARARRLEGGAQHAEFGGAIERGGARPLARPPAVGGSRRRISVVALRRRRRHRSSRSGARRRPIRGAGPRSWPARRNGGAAAAASAAATISASVRHVNGHSPGLWHRPRRMVRGRARECGGEHGRVERFRGHERPLSRGPQGRHVGDVRQDGDRGRHRGLRRRLGRHQPDPPA